MDEDVKTAIDDINSQIHVLVSLFNNQSKRLDAVQDLAVTVSSFARLTERALTEHLTALAKVAVEPPVTKPRPGPEVG